MAQRFLLGNVLAGTFVLMASALAATPDFSAMNQAFGASLWQDENLWDDDDGSVAQRLEWPEESRTSHAASFRRYAGPETRLLGARPYSLALYGKDGRVEQLSLVFANKGDVAPADPRRPDDYKRQIAADARQIETTLSAVLGPPKVEQFGEGAKTRERVERWDWQGHTILLAAPRGEYVAVRIIPTAAADGEMAPRVPDAALRATLKDRVERRPNGDVVLRDIPMVNQGPKGYCVPATWERALRYLGIPADMYVLAMAGQTQAGGGTTIDAMIIGAGEVVRRNGRRLVSGSGKLSPRVVGNYIDAGLPLMWALFVDVPLNFALTTRSEQRRHVTDWDAYRESLKPLRKDAARIRVNRANGHVCMIVGYNPETEEFAISDSWGPEFAERWITVEEANALSQGRFTVVNW